MSNGNDQAGLLGGFSTLAAVLLVAGNLATKADIAERQREDLQASLSMVIPPDSHDNDLLAAVGAAPESIAVLALDGFAVDISNDDLNSEDWIVAIKQNGQHMGVGQRGPAWVVFDPGDDKSITPEEEGSWPWAAFHSSSWVAARSSSALV